MHFVGVDLAWGDRRPTGLAVLDDEGYLLHVSAAATDDEIVAALAPYVEDDCLVDRRAADRHQRHRELARRGRAEQGLRPLRRRCAPVQHR